MRTQVLRVFWGITLLFAAGWGYLWARATVLSVSQVLWVTEGPSPLPAPRATGSRPAESLSAYRVIEERNLFNARPAPPPPPPVVVVPPPPPIQPPSPPPPPPPPPEPPLDVKLVGTAVVAGGRSLAIVATGGDVRVVREGEDITPGATILEVRSDKILVRWRERTEEFALYEARSLSPAGGRPARGRPAVGLSRQARDPKEPPAATGEPSGGDSVRKVAEDRWVLDNREVDRLRSDMGSLMTQVRVVPNFGDGGQPDGFKVFAIRPGSLFAKIGLQNGDVVRKINGIEFRGPEQAMEAYARLRDETSIQIELVRQNQSRTLNYEIR